MFRRSLFVASIVLLALPLTGFRMPSSTEARERMLYDVRGAFVTARPDVSQALVKETDTLVDSAIQQTVRSVMLPRTILAVKIDQSASASTLIGNRHLARVTVQAVSVDSGEPIAEGSFTASIFLFDETSADHQLARKIAERIAKEFRLGAGHGLLASAFAD